MVSLMEVGVALVAPVIVHDLLFSLIAPDFGERSAKRISGKEGWAEYGVVVDPENPVSVCGGCDGTWSTNLVLLGA
jgi:hypothetical protein